MSLFLRALACCALFLLAGCTKPPPPVVILAANQDGRVQFDYFGGGVYGFTRNLDAFSFQVGRELGQPWIRITGAMKIGKSNDVSVAVHSVAKMPYTIQFKGLSKSSNDDIPEARANEVVAIPAGNWSCTNYLFIIYTYDFAKR